MKKTVVSIVRGGIGNQLFIYAASRAIAARNNSNLVLATDLFVDEPHGRHFLLEKYRIKGSLGSLTGSGVGYSATKHKLACKLNKQLYLLGMSVPHYLIERTKKYFGKRAPVDRRVLSASFKDYLIVDGFFQNESYFSDIRQSIKEELQLKDKPCQETQDLSEIISRSNSVCIHFRRTELEQKAMLDKHGNKHWMGGYREGLGTEYYTKAINIIEQQVDSPEYFCFSDHPEWVRDNVNIAGPVTYISHNNTQDTCIEDLHLMNKCKHHIISHSTFGWWGAWLAENVDQVVIVPRNVCNRPKPPDYPEHWLKIDVCQKKL